MTEQTNADLVAEIVNRVREVADAGKASSYVNQLPVDGDWGFVQTLWPVAVAVEHLVAALETAEQLAETRGGDREPSNA